MSIVWKKEYSVEIKEIDDQHQVLFGIINRLYDMLNNYHIERNLDIILKELIDYAEIHLSFEENFFKKFNYEDAKNHINEHNEYRKKTLLWQQETDKDDIKMFSEIIDFLEDWWVDHVENVDKKYMKCFHDHGLF